MTTDTVTFIGGKIFDGSELLADHCAIFVEGHCAEVKTEIASIGQGEAIDLNGDILSVGFADLQVNGGGGVMLNDGPCVQNLSTIAVAHRNLGTTCFLPCLLYTSPSPRDATLSRMPSSA